MTERTTTATTTAKAMTTAKATARQRQRGRATKGASSSAVFSCLLQCNRRRQRQISRGAAGHHLVFTSRARPFVCGFVPDREIERVDRDLQGLALPRRQLGLL